MAVQLLSDDALICNALVQRMVSLSVEKFV